MRTTETLHVNRLLESPAVLDRFQILCIPGGFSFGDDVAAGQIFAVGMRHHLAGRLPHPKAAGKPILGICNGFQVMIKSGILLDDEPPHGPPATLTYNDSGKYEDRWVRLGVAPPASGYRCVFLRGIERMYLPVAHGEGKFIARDAAALARLDAAGQLVLRYVKQGAGSGEQAEKANRRMLLLPRSPLTCSPPPSLSRQPQRLDGRRRRRLRHDRPGPGADAAPRAASRSHAPSPLDPRRGRPSGRRPASVPQRGAVFRVTRAT